MHYSGTRCCHISGQSSSCLQVKSVQSPNSSGTLMDRESETCTPPLPGSFDQWRWLKLKTQTPKYVLSLDDSIWLNLQTEELESYQIPIFLCTCSKLRILMLLQEITSHIHCYPRLQLSFMHPSHYLIVCKKTKMLRSFLY